MTTSKAQIFPGFPVAFTEHGAIMAATVLNSDRAIKLSVYVVRAFVKLREMLGTQKEFAHKLGELETKFAEHDKKFTVVFQAIRELMQPLPFLQNAASGFPRLRRTNMNVTDQNTVEDRVHEAADFEEAVDVKTAARFLGVSPSLVYAYVERKQIPHFRMMGRTIRFSLSELEKWRRQFFVDGGIDGQTT